MMSTASRTFSAATQGCAPVINEVLTGTAATGTEEFVEIVNPCTTPLNVDGWRLVYRSANNTAPPNGADSMQLALLQGNLLPGGVLVFGGPGYHGPSNGALQGGIAASGAVALRDRELRLGDSVGFGQVQGNAFVEGTPAPAPPAAPSPGMSISRLPNGIDTNDNGRDFLVTAPTPMAANMKPGAPAAILPGAPPSVPSAPSVLQTPIPFPDNNGLLYACLNPNGQLRAIAPNIPCAAGEQRIHWLVVPDPPKP